MGSDFRLPRVDLRRFTPRLRKQVFPQASKDAVGTKSTQLIPHLLRVKSKFVEVPLESVLISSPRSAELQRIAFDSLLQQQDT